MNLKLKKRKKGRKKIKRTVRVGVTEEEVREVAKWILAVSVFQTEGAAIS